MDTSYMESWMGGEPAAGSEFQGIWVIGETEAGRLTPLTSAITGRARELANALGASVKGFLFGSDLAEPAGQMIKYGADAVGLFEEPALARFGLEPYLAALAGAIEAGQPEIVLFGATSLAGELAPRLAQRFGGPLFTHCTELGLDEMQRALVATHPLLGGEYFEISASPTARPQFATVEPGALPVPFPDEYRFGEVETAAVSDLPAAAVQDLGPAPAGETPPLNQARVVVCAGRGLQDAEGLKLAEELAARLGGQVAGTRGALDEGWICEERMIGIAGATVKPALYVGCGVAGAVQHVVGMQDAGFIVAISDDPQAEIFAVADMGIVGDAKEVLRELNEALKQ